MSSKQTEKSHISPEIYAEFLHTHEGIIRDESTMLSFKSAIEANAKLFRDAIVLEVNCGSALLSLWAAQQGARRVIAVEPSSVWEVARLLVHQNHFEHLIEVIHGNVEELELPPVDIIISKWMGACLMYSSVLEAVIFARDKWLKPGGHIFPHKANLYMVAAEQSREPQDMPQYWKRYSGLDLTRAWRIKQQVPCVECVDACQVLTQRQLIRTIDMRTLQCKDLSFGVSFRLRTLRQSIARLFLLYFDVRFPNLEQQELKLISTSPSAEATQWKQTLFHIGTHLPLCVGDILTGYFRVERGLRHLDFDIDWSFRNKLTSIKLHKQIYRMQSQEKTI